MMMHFRGEPYKLCLLPNNKFNALSFKKENYFFLLSWDILIESECAVYIFLYLNILYLLHQIVTKISLCFGWQKYRDEYFCHPNHLINITPDFCDSPYLIIHNMLSHLTCLFIYLYYKLYTPLKFQTEIRYKLCVKFSQVL